MLSAPYVMCRAKRSIKCRPFLTLHRQFLFYLAKKVDYREGYFDEAKKASSARKSRGDLKIHVRAML